MTEPETPKAIQEITLTRQQRAQAFASYLKERIIDWQYKNREWITSASEVGKLLNVSDVTANDWLRGKTLPRREHCAQIAFKFGIPMVEVLEAAGYPATQDDSYNTYAALISAAEQESSWDQSKRERIHHALIEAISPPFTTTEQAKEWRELAALVLQQKSTPASKAEKIANIIVLWHNQ